MNHEIHYYVGNDELFVDSTFTIDEVFNDSTQYLFVKNQEEKDYYSGLQLMYGRTMHIITRDEWAAKLKQAFEFYMPMTYYATYGISKFTEVR